jgi:type II secretory pathway pseudopilin PulG
MKRIFKNMLGVTLLEVMLVLAVAAMIIVMSVRYYQSATTNQQANAALEQIQAITAAANQLAQGTGTYNAAGSTVSNTSVAPLVPTNSLTASPWGDKITIGGATANTYTVSFSNMPAGVCSLTSSHLGADSHYSGYPLVAACNAKANFAYTYTANP